MMRTLRTLAYLAAAHLAALVVAGAGHAQTYPGSSVRIIVPYPAGGPTDLIARIAAQKLSDALGQQFFVENVSGGSGVRGATLAAAAAPDGHTLLCVTNDLALAPTISKSVHYDPIRDFAPIGIASSSPSAVLVHPSVPARTMQELVVLARNDPGKYGYASMSLGQNLLMTEKLFRLNLQLPIVRVPFPGAAPILTSTVAGHTLIAYIGLPPSMPYIREGTLRALAVTSPQRSPVAPDVPTLAESGIPEESELTIGLVAPAGTPRPVIELLSQQLARIVALPDVRERLASFGFVPVGSTPEAFAAQIKADVERGSRIVREAGIKVE